MPSNARITRAFDQYVFVTIDISTHISLRSVLHLIVFFCVCLCQE